MNYKKCKFARDGFFFSHTFAFRRHRGLCEELKLFQSVAARFNFFARDRPDLLFSVNELMRKMASPRARDLIALKRIARYTIKYPRMACRYPWTPLESISARKTTVEGVAM